MNRTTIQIDAGFASAYFVTDAENMVAVIEKPFLILSDGLLGIRDISEGLAKISERNSRGLFAQTKRFSADQFEKCFEALLTSRNESAVHVSQAVLLLSRQLDRRAVVGLKLMKLRGYGLVFAIQYPALSATELALRLGLGSEYALYEGGTFKIYQPLNQLCVVGGIKQTVLSTEHNGQQLLRSYPTLATKGHPPVSEPLME